MKQPIKNIISIVLLVFYLAGFCGIHLLKQTCSSCNHSSNLLTQTYSSVLEKNDCFCHNHTYSPLNLNQTINDENDTNCCGYQLIYLKNNPTTTIIKQNKAPLVNETVLFTCQDIRRLTLLSETRNIEQVNFFLLPYSDTDLNMICTYRC